ncbi:meiosis regulator and mRNA stability factor 1-like [Metopolophium dirhodum]|uniref:meiosis regulator and mRNA stability factor 1-like n=1 Tax=Metopolophium dirhodum TaxID=44670 RepID=UPI00298F6C77|nr:meiosis regulator and mRNA stability factor 1-like [Metopolophium dirhodum]
MLSQRLKRLQRSIFWFRVLLRWCPLHGEVDGLWKPNWKFGILLFNYAMVVMRLRMTFSNIFPRTGRRLIGRNEKGCSGGLPGVSTVTMNDDFQVVGKVEFPKTWTKAKYRFYKSEVPKKFLFNNPIVIVGRAFDPVDYGLCSLDDLLTQVSENTVVIGHLDGQKSVAIPKREQTPEEIERTKAFAKEVIELLSHAPQCCLLFNKFIPSYHHHFGHQCKVADFGFTKLIELFESIPHIVKIEDDLEGERRVSLTTDVKQNVLGDQLAALAVYPLQISQLQNAFLWQYGYALKPSVYECETLIELLQKLDDAVKVVDNHGELFLIAVDRKEAQRLSLKVRRVLMEHSSNDKMSVLQFQSVYQTMFGESINIETMQEKLGETIKIVKTKFGEEYVQLTPLQLFAQDMYRLLMISDGRLLLTSLEAAYLRLFGTAIQPAVYGYQSVMALITSIPHTVLIENKPPKRYIILNRELASVGIHLPNSIIKSPMPDQMTKNNYSKPDMSLMNHNENLRENNVLLPDENKTPVVVKLPDLKLHPNIFNMSPMSLINCTSPQAPHPSQVPMPTELCPPFGDKYKPITTINNNNHYNDNQFCCPMMGNNDLPNTNDQGDQNQRLVHQMNDRFL